MTLSGDKAPGTGETYLCLSASHHFASEAYGSGDAGSDGYAFTGSYVLMPDIAPMAPPKRTPLAVVQGRQTAEVVGEGEIDCDEYGCILVRFHWDLANAYSMRCRVSQNWAGAGWGGMVIPRIGMEVLVEFLEGDPDKPVVVGNVFNGKNDAPYPLPQHKTRSTFRTNSHDGKGSGRGFNELRFEDQQGEEEIYIHAQKDMNTAIEKDMVEVVGGSRHAVTDHFLHEVVQLSKQAVTGFSESKNVGRTYLLQVGVGAGMLPAYSRFIDKASVNLSPMKSLFALHDFSAGPGYFKTVEGDNMAMISGHSSEAVERTKTISAGESMAISSQANISLATNSRLAATAEGEVIVMAGKKITLRCGKSELTMTEDGRLLLNGTRIDLN